VVTFDGPLNGATVTVDDFQVVGYNVQSATFGGPANNLTVTLNLWTGPYPDTGAVPTVKFFPGVLAYQNGTVVMLGTDVFSITSTDGAAPFIDLVYGGLGMALTFDTGAWQPTTSVATIPTTQFYSSWSEKVNVTSSVLSCSPPAVFGNTLATAGPATPFPAGANVAATQFAIFSSFTTPTPAQPGFAFAHFWNVNTGTNASGMDKLIITTTDQKNIQAKWRGTPSISSRVPFAFFRSGNLQGMGGGVILNDATATYGISNISICTAGNGGCNANMSSCTTTAQATPTATAQSLDTNGDGTIDTILITTKSYRFDMGSGTYEIGSANETVLENNAQAGPFLARPTVNNYVQNPPTFSLPSYTFGSATSGLGYILLPVTGGAPAGNTAAIAGTVSSRPC